MRVNTCCQAPTGTPHPLHARHPLAHPLQIDRYDFSRPGPSGQASQFAQIVWASTSRVGCAIAAACSWHTYVCRFSPPAGGGHAGSAAGASAAAPDWASEVRPPLPGFDSSKAGSQASGLILAHAVQRPQPPADLPRAHWARIGEPLASGGQPFSAAAQEAPLSAAVVAPSMQEALDRTNAYRWVQGSD